LNSIAGLFLGQLLSGFIAQWLSLRIALLVTLIIIVLDALFVLFLLPDTKQKENFPFEWKRINPFRSFYLLTKNKFVLGLAIIYFLAFLGEAGIIDTVVLFLKYKFHFNPLQIGISLAIIGIGFILQSILIRIIISRIGERKTTLLALGVDVISGWLYGSIPVDLPYLLIILFLLRAIALMTGPSVQGMASKQFNKSQQGEVLGSIAGLRNLTLFLGPLIFNNLFAFYISENAWPFKIPGIVYFLCSFVWAICFCVAFFLFRYFPESPIQTIEEEEENLVFSEQNDNLTELENNTKSFLK